MTLSLQTCTVVKCLAENDETPQEKTQTVISERERIPMHLPHQQMLSCRHVHAFSSQPPLDSKVRATLNVIIILAYGFR